VRAASSSLVFDLAFTPPNDSGYPNQQVAGVRVAIPENAVPDQVLRTAVLFTGRVLMEGAPDPSGLRARVEAVRAGEIAGTSIRASAVTIVDPLSGRRLFKLSVPPGTYEVRVFPEDPDLPPYRMPAPLELTTSLEKDLVLPPLAAYRILRGQVVRGSGGLAVAGALAQALDAGGLVASTVSRTGADGRFQIRLPPGDTVSYTLRVTRSTDGPKIPTVDWPVTVGSGLDIGTLSLGTFDDPVTVVGVVRGRPVEMGALPVAGATVRVTGAVGNGTWTEQVATGPSGEARLELPPARYTLEIRPPLESDHAHHTGTLVVAGETRVDWVLGRKGRLWGQVTDPAGRAVPGILVQAVRRGALAPEADGFQYIRGVDTDAGGRYQILLDAGLYDLFFVPAGRPLARGEIVSFAMRSEDQRHDQRLPDGVVVSGVVRDIGGRPFPGVTVEVYGSAGTGGAAAKILGSGISDAGGRYRVVIPAPSR
jgi:hypothetical protein